MLSIIAQVTNVGQITILNFTSLQLFVSPDSTGLAAVNPTETSAD